MQYVDTIRKAALAMAVFSAALSVTACQAGGSTADTAEQSKAPSSTASSSPSPHSSSSPS